MGGPLSGGVVAGLGETGTVSLGELSTTVPDLVGLLDILIGLPSSGDDSRGCTEGSFLSGCSSLGRGQRC